MVPSGKRVVAADHVLVKQLDGEAVLLNLDSERYYGLNETGARMWTLLTSSPSIDRALEVLMAEYDVQADGLRRDLDALVDRLHRLGMIEVVDE